MENNIEQIDYEREVIIRLLKTKTPKEIANQLCIEMFTNLQYRKIFKHCIELINKDGFIDIYALTAKLKSPAQKELLDSLNKELCITVNYRFYIEKLHQAYFDRLIQQARSVEEMELIQEEINKWTDISIIKPISYKSENLLTDYYDKWETSIKTGFKNLDNIIGSLQSGDFLIFAGATSSGKTMCALNIMLNIAKQGHKCTFYSLEMSLPQLQNADIHYVIAGDGELDRYLKELVNKVGVSNQVHFLGYRTDINQLCNASDIFVMPSFQEGLSVALMEAMSCGLPVIASRIRGNVDLIVEGKGGILVSPDQPDEYADAIKDLTGNVAKRGSFGAFNRQAVKSYDIQCVREQLQKVFREIAGESD